MLNIAICEDEEYHNKILVDLINSYQFVQDYALETFQSGRALINEFQIGKRFDMIFLDMRLNDEDGIDVANDIRKFDTDARIIITTSLIEYAIQGYSVQASNFLLKPITRDKLYPVLEKFEQDINNLTTNFIEIEINKQKIILRTDEILYFESFGRKIKVVTFDDEYEYYYSISELEKELDADRFIRCHRSYVLNFENVKSIKKGNAILKTEEVVPISPKNSEKVYDEFTKFLGRNA